MTYGSVLGHAGTDPLDVDTLGGPLDVWTEMEVARRFATRFADRFRLMAFAPTLAELDLSDNEITDAGAEVLCLVLHGVRLRLRGNRVTPAGAERLRRRFGEQLEL